MSGRQLEQELIELGIPVAEFSRESKVSIPTLNKIFADKFVRETSRNRAFTAYRRMKRQLLGEAIATGDQKATG